MKKKASIQQKHRSRSPNLFNQSNKSYSKENNSTEGKSNVYRIIEVERNKAPSFSCNKSMFQTCIKCRI